MLYDFYIWKPTLDGLTGGVKSKIPLREPWALHMEMSLGSL